MNHEKHAYQSTGVRFQWYGLLLGLILWLIISMGDPQSLIIGIPTIALGGYLYQRIHQGAAVTIRPIHYLRFMGMFLYFSFQSGVDIMKRVLSPTLRVDPGYILFTTRLESVAEKAFFANVVSLIPGTISIQYTDDQLKVHVIDMNEDIEAELLKVENLVAPLFSNTKEKGTPST